MLYGCEPCYPVNKTDREKLEKSHKFACRIMSRDFRRSTTYQSLLTTLDLQPLWQTVLTKRLILFHSYILGLRHSPLNVPLLAISDKRRSARTNHDLTVDIPFGRHRFLKSAFVCTATAYNLLPNNIIHQHFNKFIKSVSETQLIQTLITDLRLSNSKIVQVIDI